MTGVLPPKRLIKKSVWTQRFQRFHSARPPEPATCRRPGGAAHLAPPFFLIIVSDKHTASSSHRQSDKYPITSSEMSVTSGWPGVWLGIMGCIAWRCPPQPRNNWGGGVGLILLITLLQLINEWTDKSERKIYSSFSSRSHKHV